MWTTGSVKFVLTTLQHFDVTLTLSENQYWRDTSLSSKEV